MTHVTDPQTRRSPRMAGFGNTACLGGRAHDTPATHLVLSRLDRVQPSGTGHRAICPACGGKSRKLSIGGGDAGNVLLHCFGGCDAADVLAAIGLTLADLYPERIRDTSPEGRRAAQQAFRQSSWGAALSMLAREADVVLIAAGELLQKRFSPDHHARLATAADRIQSAKELLR